MEDKFITRFTEDQRKRIKEKVFGSPFGLLSEVVMQDHYCRRYETINDISIRSMECVMSQNHKLSYHNNQYFDLEKVRNFCYNASLSNLRSEWSPSGRGHYAAGTDLIWERGSGALYNCAFTLCDSPVEDMEWAMLSLMYGMGVGFRLTMDKKYRLLIRQPPKQEKTYVVKDNRESWSKSVGILINTYLPNSKDEYYPYNPVFDYSKIRKRGSKIKTMNGIAPGPDPLIKLHNRIRSYLTQYYEFSHQYINDRENLDVDIIKRINDDISCMSKDINKLYDEYDETDHVNIEESSDGIDLIHQKFDDIINIINELEEEEENKSNDYNETRLCADLANSIGSCVADGGVRRSAEILLSSPDDNIFIDLKDNNVHPKGSDRSDIMYYSNNSLVFEKRGEFEKYLHQIITKASRNGEPGILNMKNIKQFGRYNDEEIDNADGINPCGEIPLADKEVCCLAEIYINNCFDEDGSFDVDSFFQAIEYATFYALTINTILTHSDITNKIINKNHRIGISISGGFQFYEKVTADQFIKNLKIGYEYTRKYANELANEYKINCPIRVTTNKPSGTVSLCYGSTPGIHAPVFSKCIRNVIIGKNSPISDFLIAKGLIYEQHLANINNWVFQFYLDYGDIRESSEINIWEQYEILKTFQREWADNSVSATIYFDPNNIEEMIRATTLAIPQLKCVSFFPQDNGSYKQAPFERFDKTNERHLEIKRLTDKTSPDVIKIDWNEYSKLGLSDGIDERYCTNDKCVM